MVFIVSAWLAAMLALTMATIQMIIFASKLSSPFIAWNSYGRKFSFHIEKRLSLYCHWNSNYLRWLSQFKCHFVWHFQLLYEHTFVLFILFLCSAFFFPLSISLSSIFSFDTCSHHIIFMITFFFFFFCPFYFPPILHVHPCIWMLFCTCTCIMIIITIIKNVKHP